MTAVTIAGIVAGGILILAAVTVFLIKKEFPAGGVTVTLIGLVLIGMSQWSSIKLTAAGVTLEALTNNVKQMAAAAEEVATQAEQAAAGVETTRQQLVGLSQELETKQVLPPAVVRPIQSKLYNMPRADLSKLAKARADLRSLR